MPKIVTLAISLVLAWLLAGVTEARSEVSFSSATSQGTDGRTYRQTTFRFDLKAALSNKPELLDTDFRSKAGFAGNKMTLAGFNPDQTEMYVAGQISNKKDGDPDIGLSWEKPPSIKMNYLGNGVYEVTIPLLDGATYDYKFLAWDKKSSQSAYTKDPDNPVVSDKKYGNSRITVIAPEGK